MGRIAYVNGRYRPRRDAIVNIEDRGYQFGDGICEVVFGATVGSGTSGQVATSLLDAYLRHIESHV